MLGQFFKNLGGNSDFYIYIGYKNNVAFGEIDSICAIYIQNKIVGCCKTWVGLIICHSSPFHFN